MTMTIVIAHIYIMHYCCLINTPVNTASPSFLEITKEIREKTSGASLRCCLVFRGEYLKKANQISDARAALINTSHTY